MQQIGVRLGADVPACFYNKPISATGIGEIIEEIDTSLKYYLCIIRPKFSCNTKLMFEKIDETNEIKQEYNSEKVKQSIENKNIEELGKNLYNVFENCVENIENVKKELINLRSNRSCYDRNWLMYLWDF